MREEEIKKKLWCNFLVWMQGQTVSKYEDGSTNYYEWDVLRYMR